MRASHPNQLRHRPAGLRQEAGDRYVTQVESELATWPPNAIRPSPRCRRWPGRCSSSSWSSPTPPGARCRRGVSFRHLGARVEQILALAEDQADDLRNGAAQEIADQRARGRAPARRRPRARRHRHPRLRPGPGLPPGRGAQGRGAPPRRAEEETQRLRTEARELLAHSQLEAQGLRHRRGAGGRLPAHPGRQGDRRRPRRGRQRHAAESRLRPSSSSRPAAARRAAGRAAEASRSSPPRPPRPRRSWPK